MSKGSGKPPAAMTRPGKRLSPEAATRIHSQGVQAIESVLSPSNAPVLGLYLHTVHILLMRSLSRSPRFRAIMPYLMGTLALLLRYPGLSQTELAGLLGTERASAGAQVRQCLSKGLVRRALSKKDRRRYELFVTSKGEELVRSAERNIQAHEAEFARALDASQRVELRNLLMSLVAGC